MKTTFGELASAVGKVTPVAAALGITTNELFSSLASTTSQGLATSESVTALKAAMSNIIKPTKEASDAAEALGMDFSASAVKSKGWMGFLTDVKDKLKQASPEYAKLSDQMSVTTKRMKELEDAGKKNTDEYKALSKNYKNLGKDMEMLAKMSDSPLSAFAQMFGSVEGLNSILMLTSDNGMKLYNQSLDQMKNNTTALDDAYAKMSETTEVKFEKAMNQAKNSLMELGVKALPIVEDGIKLFSNLIDKFDNLSPSTQEWILKIGLASAALGPFLSVAGGTVSTISNLLTMGPKIKTFFGLFTGASTAATALEGIGTASTVAAGTAGAGGVAGLIGSLGGVVIAAAPYLVAAGLIAGTGYLIYKGMTEEAVPAVDLFADKIETTAVKVEDSNTKIATSYGYLDGTVQGATTNAVSYNGYWSTNTETTVTKISDATKKAVGAYMDLDKSASQSLTNLYINSTVITDQIATESTSKYANMNTQIKAGIDKRFADELQTMTNYFATSGVLTQDEETKILLAMQTNNTNKKAEEDKHFAEIKAIWDKASSEKRALTLDEQLQINTIQGQMKVNAVQALSETEVESKVILERLKGYGERITAEQASAEIKNANKARDESVAAANDTYNKTVASIIRQRDESHTITADQADKLIADAERQRKESVDKAENMRSEVVNKVTSMDSSISSDVNTTTGNMKTSWDRFMDWWNNVFHLNPKSTRVETIQVTNHVDNWEKISANASGTNSFTGGLTTLHERGYEVYDLPKGTRIYNHQASEDIVLKTAQEVVKAMMGQFKGSASGGVQTIIVPVNLDGREITRVVAENQDILDRYNSREPGGVF